jgi:hypothetical protein
MVRTRQQVGALLVATDQVRRRDEPLKILRRQRRLPVRRQEVGIGIPPRPPPEGVPTPLERASHQLRSPVHSWHCTAPNQPLGNRGNGG